MKFPLEDEKCGGEMAAHCSLCSPMTKYNIDAKLNQQFYFAAVAERERERVRDRARPGEERRSLIIKKNR